MSANPVVGPGLGEVGVVAIGRNEGERLRRCFDSFPPEVRRIVYVDSGSTDDSVPEALRRGIEVVRLDVSVPFTAARARNAGLRRLRERWPDSGLVQFLDGDTSLCPGWLQAAVEELRASPRVAVVCGRRREARPEASIYNRLCDMEWDTPVGDTDACGGDALARVEALAEVGGYDEQLIAGEEPEMCARLRARGWTIRRIDRDMTTHDAAMSRFGQWWRRTARAGHAFAEVGGRHPALWRRNLLSSVAWGAVLPAAALLPAVATGGLSILALAAYPALWLRIVLRRRARGAALGDAALFASFCLLAKPAELGGAMKYWIGRAQGRRSAIMEYR